MTGGGGRQRLVTGVTIAMGIGLALSFALQAWSMLMVGLMLGIVLWAGSGADPS